MKRIRMMRVSSMLVNASLAIAVTALVAAAIVGTVVWAQGAKGRPGAVEREKRMAQFVDQALSRAGITLTDEQKKAVHSAVAQRFQAFRALMQARMQLFKLLRQQASNEQLREAINSYEQAVKNYEKKLDAIDKQLDAKVKYTENAKLHATLIVMGIVGRNYAVRGMGRIGGRPGMRPRERRGGAKR
ncbi:MAG TPA: hypothetical protein EYP10_08615 [Armatimonadetes bacterium]|nr:hypothetical protein [Armatimonadota bacterium]